MQQKKLYLMGSANALLMHSFLDSLI